MTKDSENTIDITAIVASHMSGVKGFANSKKVSQLGIEEYSRQLTGKLVEKASNQLNDPRRKKRAARSR